MASVSWTPYHLHRLMAAEGHNTIFVYLEASDGTPVTGVVEGDLASLAALVFAEGSSLTTQDVLLGDATFAGSWSEIGPAYPGLYKFRVSSGPYAAGADQAIFSLRLSADPDRTYLASVDLEESAAADGGDGGAGGDEGDDPNALLPSLLGYNAVYAYTAFEGSGRPTTGTMTIYGSMADAEAEENPVIEVGLAYEYENGRLVKVKKLVDLEALLGG